MERHALPQTSMAGCDYKRGDTSHGLALTYEYEKGAMQGLVVGSWPLLVQTWEQQEMGLEICPYSE